MQCTSCKAEVYRTCESCQGGYCIEHNEGCSLGCSLTNVSINSRFLLCPLRIGISKTLVNADFNHSAIGVMLVHSVCA